MTVVSMSLDQVAGSRARARANQSASLPAYQCATDRPYHSSDDCALGSAVVLTMVVASLRVYIASPECAN
jgi:ABC-type phosphate transport system permease subunit